jgi:3-hydroxyisobutyrate dehydrogenase-like beta-hydroxyacid dehydrogenase
MDIGFIGLGSMGRAMALNALKAGHSVRVWNRSHDGIVRLMIWDGLWFGVGSGD